MKAVGKVVIFAMVVFVALTGNGLTLADEVSPRMVLGYGELEPVVFFEVKAGMKIQFQGSTYDPRGKLRDMISRYPEVTAVRCA